MDTRHEAQGVKKPISEVQTTGPHPVGPVKHKESERGLGELQHAGKPAGIDESGNQTVYKASGLQGLAAMLLILTSLAVCAS